MRALTKYCFLFCSNLMKIISSCSTGFNSVSVNTRYWDLEKYFLIYRLMAPEIFLCPVIVSQTVRIYSLFLMYDFSYYFFRVSNSLFAMLSIPALSSGFGPPSSPLIDFQLCGRDDIYFHKLTFINLYCHVWTINLLNALRIICLGLFSKFTYYFSQIPILVI